MHRPRRPVSDFLFRTQTPAPSAYSGPKAWSRPQAKLHIWRPASSPTLAQQTVPRHIANIQRVWLTVSPVMRSSACTCLALLYQRYRVLYCIILYYNINIDADGRGGDQAGALLRLALLHQRYKRVCFGCLYACVRPRVSTYLSLTAGRLRDCVRVRRCAAQCLRDC